MHSAGITERCTIPYIIVFLFFASLLIEFHILHKIHHSENHHHAGFRSTRHIHCRRQLCYRSGMPAILLWQSYGCKERKKTPFFLLSILIIYACAFAFSVFAPGNTVRQSTVTSQPNVVSAFFIAIAKGIEFLAGAIKITEILMFTILIPFLARLAKASHFRFSHPWLYLLISFLLYCAFFFPNSYAMGTERSRQNTECILYVHGG